MNWGTGVTTESGRIVAKVTTNTENSKVVKLEDLVREGVPTAEGLQRKHGIVSSFRNWRKVSLDSYAAAYCLNNEIVKTSKHQVFEFQVRETLFQVPALVLMRALFYPAKHLLAPMFRPQSLDDLGFLDGDILNITGGRVRDGYTWASDTVLSCLRWMYSFPSAYRMAHSVHEHAMQGIIGLTLPEASVRLVVTGKKIDNTYYVNEMTLTKIEAKETAFPWLPKLSSTVMEYERGSPTVAKNTILLRDNCTPLSNDEWHSIEPILLAHSNYRFRLSQRDLFDCILAKFHSGTPWRKVECKSGTYIHACQAYRVWKEHGTFGPALEELNRLRAPQ
jgi:hypothetical protein